MRKLIALGALFVAACAASSLPDTIAPRTFEYSDGGKARFFVIDKGGVPATGHPDTYVFVVPGSDCTSMGRWLPDYFRGLEGRAGPLRVFVVEKRAMEPRSGDATGACSDSFTRLDHPRRWIADYSEFIASALGDRRPSRIVLVGISEGGELVPHLAARIPDVTHVVLLGSGGMDPLEAFEIQAKRFGFKDAPRVLAVAAGPAPADADAPRDELGGRSWRYWSELRELQPASNLAALDIPIFVGMGEQDQSMPVEAAWRLRDQFAARGKSNLTLQIYDGADHGFFEASRRISWLPDFWQRVDLWLLP